jgi:hypothetical protein
MLSVSTVEKMLMEIVSPGSTKGSIVSKNTTAARAGVKIKSSMKQPIVMITILISPSPSNNGLLGQPVPLGMAYAIYSN